MNNKKISLLYLGALSAISLVSFDLFQPSLPTITEYFHSTHGTAQFTLSLYLLIFGLAQLIWGPAVDHFGRIKTLHISLGLFVIASLICVFSQSMMMLIIGRVLQGFAACCAGVMSFSVSRDYDEVKERAKLISHISMIVSVSPIFAPAIGAFIFTYFDWQANFIVMALFACILLLLVKSQVIEGKNWLPPVDSFNLTTTIERYKPCFKNKLLWAGLIIICASFSTIMIVVINIAWLVIGVLHYKPTTFAYLFALNGTSMIIGNYLSIKFREKYSLQASMYVGSVIIFIVALIMIVLNYIYG